MSKILITNLKKRHRSEKRFILFGKISIGFSIGFLIFLISMIIFKGYGSFIHTKIALEINPALIKNNQDLRPAIKESLRKINPQLSSLEDLNSLYQLISKVAKIELEEQLAKSIKEHKQLEPQYYWLSASSKVDMYIKHDQHETLNQIQLDIVRKLRQENRLKTFFNWNFFKFSDSREPEIAGIKAGFTGSLLVMIVFLLCSFPIAIMCAFYLEEFAPKNYFTDIIEISINNLAGIPSIIYGLLGLTLYLQTFHFPRSSSLVGGLTLFILVLPVIIIATRNTIRSIPNSIRDGALAIGASKMQLIWHHLLPLSVPGIMTGTILAISRALGETAPLLMIGMIAFIADVPQNLTDPSSTLAVQIYLWSDLPEFGFVEKTSGAIIILLGFLIILNSSAIILRKKFERKW